MPLIPAAPVHAAEIAAIHVRSWQIGYAGILRDDYLSDLSVERRLRQWQDSLAKTESRTLVAQTAHGIAGFVCFGPWRSDGATDTQGEIWALYVDPPAWGQGHGQALMTAAVAELQAQGRTEVFLWVLSRNTRGLRFYEAFGFQTLPGSEKRFELGGTVADEVCMRLTASDPGSGSAGRIAA